MNWQTIENSSALKAYAYDDAAFTLGIQTGDGRSYFYLDVPPGVRDEFLAASSKGKYWLSQIKTRFQCQRGDGTLVAKSPDAKPVEPKAAEVIEGSAVATPVAALSISFEAGMDSIGLTPLPFEQMIAKLQKQMDAFFGPVAGCLDVLVIKAMTMTVSDSATCEQAAKLGTQLADQRRQITDKLRPTKQSIDQVKAVVLAKEKELVGRCSAGEDHLSKAVTDYRTAEQKRAQEAAEATRKRLLKEAEDGRIAQAEMAQNAGKTKLAEALLSTPVTAPKVEVKADVPKGAGTARVNWKWKITDITKVPDEFWMLDETAIGQRVRADKDKTSIPGIEAYPDEKTNF